MDEWIEWFEERSEADQGHRPRLRSAYSDMIVDALLDIFAPARLSAICAAEREGRLRILPETGIGELSDGYHTFNELYHHRAVLFSVICNQNASLAWKSKQHSDGTMFDGYFIVGINTPDGPATYHYALNPYWGMFHVAELQRAPEWDGHTAKMAIDRIGKLYAQAALDKEAADEAD